jgi:hypothetical protein
LTVLALAVTGPPTPPWFAKRFRMFGGMPVPCCAVVGAVLGVVCG